MKRNASSVDILAPATGLLFEGIVATTNFLGRRPGFFGGVTAFAVSFLFISANAAWYQPYRHPAPLFSTGAGTAEKAVDAKQAVRVRIERDGDVAAGDPDVEFVQRALTDMSLYTGSIDGVSGPRTREAIAEFRSRAGLDPKGGIDGELLRQLKHETRAPVPTPAPRANGAREPDEIVAAVQGLLVAAGYREIDIDGLLGARTSAAIRDFRQRNAMPDTGSIDGALIKALRKASPPG